MLSLPMWLIALTVIDRDRQCVSCSIRLSPKLYRTLADILPGLESVYDHALVGATDPVIFDWARTLGFEALLT